MTEGSLWRAVAVVLAVLLGLSLVVNLSGASGLPRPVTLFLFGALVSLGVGYSIVNPRSSPVVTRRGSEPAFRRRQIAAGMVMSLVLAAVLLFSPDRGSPLLWLFLPVIILPFALLARELALTARRRGHRRRTSPHGGREGDDASPDRPPRRARP